MPINKDTTTQVRVAMPLEIHQQLKAIARSRGLSLSQLMLQAAIERWLPELGKP